MYLLELGGVDKYWREAPALPAHAPGPRRDFSLATVRDGAALVLAGGVYRGTELRDVWTLHVATGVWRTVAVPSGISCGLYPLPPADGGLMVGSSPIGAVTIAVDARGEMAVRSVWQPLTARVCPKDLAGFVFDAAGPRQDDASADESSSASGRGSNHGGGDDAASASGAQDAAAVKASASLFALDTKGRLWTATVEDFATPAGRS